MVNQTLLTALRGYDGENTQLGDTFFTDAVKATLSDAVLKFNLAPDLFVDIGRLPPKVTDFATLVAFLGEIQDLLSKKDNKTKNEDWEVAKDGRLRLYKLYVCCIHALHAYVTTATPPSYAVTPRAMATNTCNHARSNVPEDLGGKAKILWEKTFASGNPRTVKVMLSVIYFLRPSPAAGNNNNNNNPTGTA